MARQRGRKSAEQQIADIRLAASRKGLEPPEGLLEGEADVFRDIVDDWPPDHFRASDLPLLTAFCRLVIFERKAAKEAYTSPENLKLHLDATRALTSAATKLRLTPQSRYDPKTTARKNTTGNRVMDPEWLRSEAERQSRRVNAPWEV